MKEIILIICYILLTKINLYSQINNYFTSDSNESTCEVRLINDTIIFNINIFESNTLIPYICLQNKLLKTTKDLLIVDSLIINIDSGYSGNTLIKTNNDDLYLLGIHNGNSSDFAKIKLTKINTSLEIELIKEFTTRFNGLYDATPFVVDDKFYIVLSGMYTEPLNIPHTQIYDLNINFDTLHTYDYNESINMIINIPFEDNYFIAEQHWDIMKVDTTFNSKWLNYRKIILFTANNLGSYYWKDNSNIVIITPTYEMFSSISQIGIFSTDTSFQLSNVQSISYGDSEKFDLLGFVSTFKSENMGYFIASFDMNDFPDYSFMDHSNKITIRNYSNDLDFVWEKKIGNSDSSYYVYNILDICDGFLLTGSKHCPFDSIPNFDVFIYKFDYNGNFYSVLERPGGKLTANVFPNPGTDYFNLTLYTDYNNSELYLYDMSGRLLLQQDIKQKHEKIFTPLLSSGTYTYSIVKNGNVIYSGKWVKR